MADVEVISERESTAGWTFTVQVLDDAGSLSKHEVTLAWVDYNLWSVSGADAPSQVAAAVVRFLLTKVAPSEVRKAFDASIVRRMFPEADAGIPGFIG